MGRKIQIVMLAIVVIVAIGAATVLPSLANSEGNSEGTSTGSFSLNNSPPASLTFTLYENDHTSKVENKHTDPQAEYALRINVTDWNTLNDISEIKVIIKTNSTNTGDQDNVSKKATYKWTPSGGWSLAGPSNSTWNITDDSKAPSDFSATTGTWWLHFKPGKVAMQTVNNNTHWDIYVKVTDNGGLTTEGIAHGYHMNWYGEVSVLNASYSFGSINLDDTNRSISSPLDENIDVRTISNGNYKIQSKSVWTNVSNTSLFTFRTRIYALSFRLCYAPICPIGINPYSLLFDNLPLLSVNAGALRPLRASLAR